jgi:hypothetical protein
LCINTTASTKPVIDGAITNGSSGSGNDEAAKITEPIRKPINEMTR